MLSGQVAVDDDGAVVAPGNITAQAERIFETVGGVPAAHGAGFGAVLEVEITAARRPVGSVDQRLGFP